MEKYVIVKDYYGMENSFDVPIYRKGEIVNGSVSVTFNPSTGKNDLTALITDENITVPGIYYKKYEEDSVTSQEDTCFIKKHATLFFLLIIIAAIIVIVYKNKKK